MFVLGGDVGGTHARLAIFEFRQGGLSLVAKQIYSSQSSAQFANLLEEFLRASGLQVAVGCIGVAGPVQNARCEVTNLPWILDANALAQKCCFRQLELINDLEANAWGIEGLSADDFSTVLPGDKFSKGNRAVISPGTGLGEAGILQCGESYLPFATEGGHCDFGPRNSLQEELLSFLQRSIDHVSYEEILGGSGLERIYDFFASRLSVSLTEEFKDEMTRSGKAATISAWAIAKKCMACQQSLNLYLEILGQETANLALKTLATGGVFVGGGIAAKLATTIKTSEAFRQGFQRKGKMTGLLSRIPVSVILNPDTALIGAALKASRLVGSGARPL